MHLLIIDDEANIRRTTAVALEGLGHATAGAENRAEALKHLEADHFDLAFLDLKLDGESGLDLLPEMLKLEPRLEVVVFTAYASIETAVEAMRRGAVDYIPKPFTPEQIRRVLNRTMEARRQRGYDRVRTLSQCAGGARNEPLPGRHRPGSMVRHRRRNGTKHQSPRGTPATL
jgi:two-component system, NtrC family, response regulator AlgB